ncbi:hypothetical protein [Chelativorans alearense]|uniref:hypothetical protein n=1 Tax=Chelativorans alearense TaxID=2681495 RepID=UPI001969AE06|nr:hypothetical protein [Chelativorans alearense]
MKLRQGQGPVAALLLQFQNACVELVDGLVQPPTDIVEPPVSLHFVASTAMQ